MISDKRVILAVERVCLAILFVWLVALPLPFGSIIDKARVPLIAVPLALCLVATLLRFYVIRDRSVTSQPTKTWLIWALGAMLFLTVGALQLVPLPPEVLRAVSPESHQIWSGASRVASLAGVNASASHPVSIDPSATVWELFRIAALFAALTASALLVRTPTRRVLLATVLCAAALFEAFYGVREAALQRYAIWGWVNKLIQNRVTGTFVNPNHFANYIAIVLPMSLFLAAIAWYRAGAPGMPLLRHLARLVERETLLLAGSLIAAVISFIAILLAQSRGGLLAAGAGIFIVAAFLPGRRILRIVIGAIAGVVLLVTLVLFLGTERTVERFVPSAVEQGTLVGRRIGINAAAGVWRRFPVLGSGLGTFEHAVQMEQREDLSKAYHHADNDYVEIAATSGTAGYLIAIVALFGGYVTLLRMTFGRAGAELSWLRRAFQAAALTSLTIALVHALFEHNFFIPSNPATLAVIAGAAVASVDHDRRTRR